MIDYHRFHQDDTYIYYLCYDKKTFKQPPKSMCLGKNYDIPIHSSWKMEAKDAMVVIIHTNEYNKMQKIGLWK